MQKLPAPSNRSPLEAFADLKVAGGDLLEGSGIRQCVALKIPSFNQRERERDEPERILMLLECGGDR